MKWAVFKHRVVGSYETVKAQLHIGTLWVLESVGPAGKAFASVQSDDRLPFFRLMYQCEWSAVFSRSLRSSEFHKRPFIQ